MKNIGKTDYIPDPSVLSKRMIKLRKEKGLTQKEVTQYLSRVVTDSPPISFSTISSWETGKRIPRTPMLVALADLYDVSVNYLIGTSDDRSSFLRDEPIYKMPARKNPIKKQDLVKYDKLPVFVVFPQNRPSPLWGIYDAANNIVYFAGRLLHDPVENGCKIYASDVIEDRASSLRQE